MVRRTRKGIKRVKFGSRKGAYKHIKGRRYKFVGSAGYQAEGNMEAAMRVKYKHVRKTKDKYGVNFWAK